MIWDHNRTYKVHRFSYDAWLLLKIGLFTLMPLILIMLQPDLGTALVFIAIMSGMILISGITWKIIVPLLARLRQWDGAYLDGYLSPKLADESRLQTLSI